MAQARNYKREYERRVRNALARGLDRSQARGHPSAGKTYASRREAEPKRAKPDRILEEAIDAMRRGETLSAAARRMRVGRERLSAYAKQYAGASRQGPAWTFNDQRVRRVPIIAAGEGKLVITKVPGFEPAHLAGQHYHEADAAITDQSLFPAFVERWRGVTITDLDGNLHTFSVDPNQLYRAIGDDEIDWTRIYHLYMR
jgi:hypothetical protein